MTSTVLDFQSEKAKRCSKTRERVAAVESYVAASRPYASLDDLPDITDSGQTALGNFLLTV